MIRDYVNNLDHFASIRSGLSLSGTTPVVGTAKEFKDHVGPVAALFVTANAANTPDSQAHVCKIQESANGSDGWTDVTGATVTATANATSYVCQGVRTKPYVRCHITPAFVGGSSPTNTMSGALLIQKAQVS